ncbi:hypothetical protein NQ318_017139 [Aromia moschata]|uniref:Uncharacterized protein n=1 Tax=Aromia moschata TaxID=1265417 RepID=A0AAV8XMP7_9CUCU|nr:hypothetical protein NQ318_017139 [Aromia moschata]
MQQRDSTVHRILKRQKYDPYKLRLAYELAEDDFDRRMEFCESIQNCCNYGDNFVTNIISDEVTFCMHAENPHWMNEALVFEKTNTRALFHRQLDNIEDLKQRFRHEIGQISLEIIRNVLREFVDSLGHCQTADGNKGQGASLKNMSKTLEIKRTLRRRSVFNKSCTRFTLSSELEVDGRPARFSSLTSSRPYAKALCHRKMCLSERQSTPKAFFNIGMVSAALLPSFTQT